MFESFRIGKRRLARRSNQDLTKQASFGPLCRKALPDESRDGLRAIDDTPAASQESEGGPAYGAHSFLFLELR